jgi:hypothetical protein
MSEQGRILKDEDFYVGGLAPSFMPESGYEYMAGVSGWPRPITPGLLGGSTTEQDFIPPEYPPQFDPPPDYDAPPEPPVYDAPEDPGPEREVRPTAGLTYSYSPYSHLPGIMGVQGVSYFGGGHLTPGDLTEYVSGWEKPGWNAGNFENLAVHSVQDYLLKTDPAGIFEDGDYPGLPATAYPYFLQQGRLEEAGTHPVNSDERKELMEAYQATEDSFWDQRNKDYETLSMSGTKFAAPIHSDHAENFDNVYSKGQMTPYGIQTGDTISTSPYGKSGGFINYNNDSEFFADILDKTSKYYSPEADKVWNMGYYNDPTTGELDPSQSYFSIDPRGMDTKNRAYWTTPSPEQLALLNPSSFSWADSAPEEYSRSLPGGLLSDPIYGIVGGGIVDAGPVMETPYG